MPILAINSMGQLYETDPDSSDGTGCKCAPPSSGGGDTTLGRAYQDAELSRVKEEVKFQTALAVQDHLDNKSQNLKRKISKQAKEMGERRLFAAAHPAHKLALMRSGIKQTNQGQYNDVIGMSGYGLSANGLAGEKGRMNRQQIAAEQILTNCSPNTSMSTVVPKKNFWALLLAPFKQAPQLKASSVNSPVYGVSKTEAEQYRLQQGVNEMHRRNALMTAKRVEQEAQNAKLTPSRDEDVIRSARSQQLQKTPQNPLAIFRRVRL